ncbi:hypothetical protein [Halorussus salinus]|uniref:hypothetical protein n=1 Tax=Halorussus salinus TaxID=1364935 RepID=UPI001091EB58|nr:hypothetical protein [Halorussus salinus]
MRFEYTPERTPYLLLSAGGFGLAGLQSYHLWTGEATGWISVLGLLAFVLQGCYYARVGLQEEKTAENRRA